MPSEIKPFRMAAAEDKVFHFTHFRQQQPSIQCKMWWWNRDCFNV